MLVAVVVAAAVVLNNRQSGNARKNLAVTTFDLDWLVAHAPVV
jgi:hypothetical protein